MSAVLNAQGLLGGAGGQSLAQTLGAMAQMKQQQEIDQNPINLLTKYGPDFMNAAGALRVNLEQAKNIAQQVEAKKMQQQRQQNLIGSTTDPNAQRNLQLQQAGFSLEDKKYEDDLVKNANRLKVNEKVFAALQKNPDKPVTTLLSDPEFVKAQAADVGLDLQGLARFYTGVTSLATETQKEQYIDQIAAVKNMTRQAVKKMGGLAKLAGDPMEIERQLFDTFIPEVAGEDIQAQNALKRYFSAGGGADDEINKLLQMGQNAFTVVDTYMKPGLKAAEIDSSSDTANAKTQQDWQKFLVQTEQKNEELKLQEAKLNQDGQEKDNVTIKTFLVGPDGTLGQDITMKVGRQAYLNESKNFYEAFGKFPKDVTKNDLLTNPNLAKGYKFYTSQIGGQ